MAYIGKNLVGMLKEVKTVNTMTGDGSDTTLTLSDTPGSVNNVLLFIDGIKQTPETDYNVIGNALTFTTAPETGTSVVAVVGNHSGIEPTDFSITSKHIVDGTVSDSHIATGISSSKLTGALPALDGSTLTGIPAGIVPLFKSASDPTITSNKPLGQLWSNSTSGEMYVCVDATTNANVWRNVGDSIGGVPDHLVATGGLITTDGDYKVHTFFSSGTFSPIALGNSATGNQVEYLVVAGGGGGGGCDVNTGVGGGGAGGYRTASNFTVSVESLTVIIGGGGACGLNNFLISVRDGSDSVFGSITSVGGGGGAQQYHSATVGGSGGGGEGFTGPGNAAGNGVGAAGTAGQGNAGGAGSQSSASYGGGGGGGAGAVGADGGSTFGGAGGVGLASDISETGVNVFRGGGGGGSTANGGTRGAGGNGGGGQGGNASVEDGLPGQAFTGGGGGAGGNVYTGDGGLGGSGVVIIRYKFQ